MTDITDWPGHPDADPDCECCLGDGLQADVETPCPCIDARNEPLAAQVAAAYEAAAIRSENYACGAPYNQRASINALANSLRGMTPDDAKAALEAHGREKVREGMQRAAELVSHSAYGTAYWATPATRRREHERRTETVPGGSSTWTEVVKPLCPLPGAPTPARQLPG